MVVRAEGAVLKQAHTTAFGPTQLPLTYEPSACVNTFPV
jgi:hypothetical protein